MPSYSSQFTFKVADYHPVQDIHTIVFYSDTWTKESLYAYLTSHFQLTINPALPLEELPSIYQLQNGLWTTFHFIQISTKGNFYFNIKARTAAALKKIKSSTIHLDLSCLNGELLPIIQALILGTYFGKAELKTYKSLPDISSRIQVTIYHHAINQELLNDHVSQSEALAEVTLWACDLVNGPANVITPTYMVETMTELAVLKNVEIKIRNRSQLQNEGFGALLAVSQGSDQEVYLVELNYHHSSDVPTIGLAGKGVTFDTGGISIKEAQNLHYMKTDMAGAATVFATVILAAKNNLPLNIVAAIPICENSVSEKAFRPGDIIKSYNGKTIEIINTDAEGRLILADALSYLVTNVKPKFLIDLATLTGACVRALGYHAAGLFTNNDELAQKLEEAGKISGELVWRLPLWDQYKNSLDSALADVKNLDDAPVAGAISAAKFLEYFTDQHPAYAHLDIAGVAFKNVDWSKEKTATGFGINLLSHWLSQLAYK